MTVYWRKQMAHKPTAHYYNALTNMVRELKSLGKTFDTVFEIGTGWGISGSVFLEEGCKHLWTLDPNMNSPYVVEATKELETKKNDRQYIHYLVKRSNQYELAPDSIARKFDVVFIDGKHDYQSVMEDLKIARRALNPKGVIICDDYSHPKNGTEYGVTKAVKDFIEHESNMTLKEDLTGNGIAAILFT